MQLPGFLEGLKPNKHGSFKYEIYMLNAFEYKCIYRFSLSNNTLKKILKFSLKKSGKTINKDIVDDTEGERIEFHPAYKSYLNKLSVGLFDCLNRELKADNDPLRLKTYEVNKAYFIHNNNLKDWNVEIEMTGLFEKC